MKLFVDTAIIHEIKDISQYAFIEGATTNPSLIAKSGQPLETVIQEICSYIDGPISAEVSSEIAEEMIHEARMLSGLNPNIVIKLPMTLEGLKAVKQLSQENIKTNVTLIFNSAQALLAAKSGATYVSPFIGRINDLGYDGSSVIEEIASIFKYYQIKTEIIAASIRTIQDLQNAALAGADIATVPYDVLIKASQHLLTSQGLDIFNQAINSQK